MAYQIEKTYTSFWGGISDDDFVGTDLSVADMEWVDVQSNDRYATAQEAYIASSQVTASSTMTWVKRTDQWSFRWSTTETYNFLGNSITGTIWAGIQGMEAYGYWTAQVNYFFGTSSIKKTNYNGTTLQATITTNYPSGETTAIGWHVTNLLFAKSNKVYYVDTANDFVSTEAVTLMPGSVVKYIYSYSFDSTIIVAINQGNTFIYEVDFTGGTYNLVGKTPSILSECFDAVGEWYSLYWLSYEWVNQYQGGQSQLIRYFPLSAASRCGWDRGVIFSDEWRVYRLGSTKPGRAVILTSNSTTTSIIDIDRNSILCGASTVTNLNILSGATKRLNTIITRPLDWTVYKDEKQDFNIEIWYLFDWGAYVNSATRQEIKVYVQTDGMELIDPDLYVSIWEVIDWDTVDSNWENKYGTLRIHPTIVADALWTAGYTSSYQYIRVKIEIKSGDEYAGNPWFYRKAPKVFDVWLYANFRNN